ncbi:hypothetical protein CCACVL1_01395 [Corchorus capsularis]|uniref:Uncharacterized protein n=1 Tax=Corchorus capsularis TaxID=210143 RepID=A0A1R3KIU8_COCAP|nr:hypothetical protein CCACVL1_01395 [Corchorus capsularis]
MVLGHLYYNVQNQNRADLYSE